MSTCRLIIGLGNPGAEYADTRHNAGFWLLDTLANTVKKPFASRPKFFGYTCKILISTTTVHLLKPMTFMNKAGQSAIAMAQFYKIEPHEILVAHDELDIDPGRIRLKKGGGHGGHNGLRDLHRVIGSEYARIRIGIGHPGHQSKVHNHVLSRAQAEDRIKIDQAIGDVLCYINDIVQDDWSQAMNTLHQR